VDLIHEGHTKWSGVAPTLGHFSNLKTTNKWLVLTEKTEDEMRLVREIERIEKVTQHLRNINKIEGLRSLTDFSNVHISSPSAVFINRHFDQIKTVPRNCLIYPFEHSVLFNGIKVFWINDKENSDD
jgi:hypothetical protein